MSDLDTRLGEALKADAPAPRDPMFRIQVMLRRERKAFRRQLLLVAAVSLGAALLSALAAGAVGEFIAPGPWQLTLMALTALVLPLVLTGAGLERLGLLGGIFGPLRARTSAVLRPLLWH